MTSASELASTRNGASTGRPRVLLLSSSPFTDRMIRYSGVLNDLAATCDVELWAMSARTPRGSAIWQGSPAEVHPFPEVGAFRQFPFGYLRRLNDAAWDFALRSPSRLSMDRNVRRGAQRRKFRALRPPARLLAAVRAHGLYEAALERLLRRVNRSPEATRRFEAHRPSLVVTTNPFWFTEPAVVASAQRLGIPSLTLIPSWDNISTKSRMTFRYDGYLVWSERQRQQLSHWYPVTQRAPVHEIGAPQFDVFFDPRFEESREAFCGRHGLRPDLPIIVYALGSPNFLPEHNGAVEFARRVAQGDLGDVQVVIRPHPAIDRAETADLFRGLGPRVVLQEVTQPDDDVVERSQDAGEILDWVSTFRHADVVVNLSSTVTVDAAIFDTPVVNIDFDASPDGRHAALIHDINHVWTHFKPVAESGGVWLARSHDDIVAGVLAYLDDPTLHREGRRWIVEHICGRADGGSGARFAAAVAATAAAVTAGR